MIYFTSDTHFGHENIIGYCERPFKNADEMDEVITSNWNALVGEDDKVYHLGDFTFGGKRAARDYFRRLNGRIFVLGNPWHHDSGWLPSVNQINTGGKLPKTGLSDFFSATHHMVTILPPMHILDFPEYGKDGYSQALVLCHYPLAVWDRKHYGAWHLHGHSHGQYRPGEGFIFDAGVDTNFFSPISIDGVVGQMKAYGWTEPARFG